MGERAKGETRLLGGVFSLRFPSYPVLRPLPRRVCSPWDAPDRVVKRFVDFSPSRNGRVVSSVGRRMGQVVDKEVRCASRWLTIMAVEGWRH